MSDDAQLRTLVANVAAAYFSNAHVNVSEIPNVVAQIAMSLAAIGDEPATPSAVDEPPKAATPAQVRKSIQHETLISFEDGRGYKTLKRHLATRGLTPELYRAKWGLPATYPMTSPAYSEQRSSMAKSLGLGQLRKAKSRTRKAKA